MACTLSPDDRKIIRQTPLFSEIGDNHLAFFLKDATQRYYCENTLLFSAGDLADRLFIIIDGTVHLFALNAKGDDTIIEVLGSGTSFAEAAIFASGTYPVYAEAIAGARILSISTATVLDALRNHPTIGLQMLGSLCLWQLRLMAELRQLKAQPPIQRLAMYLLKLTDATEGTTRVHLPYQKNVIAARIGITPESLSRALARLTRLGIESTGETIVIHDVAALYAFCGRRPGFPN